ncbi:MAG: hypothetical protein IJ866_02170 [Alphaproteobacteria bacterium]|nr:hypothetical protein [Alphaproteobacteria bacterium]
MTNKTRKYILEYQRTHHLPDFAMCNILCIYEPDWNKYKNGRGFTLTTFNKIMFIVNTNTPLP